MWTLRLVLIALGLVFIAGLYFYTRRHPPGRRAGRFGLRDPAGSALRAREQVEPRLTVTPEAENPEPAAIASGALLRYPGAATAEAEPRSEPDLAGAKLFALSVRLPDEGTSAAIVTRTLIRLGCVPDDGIYHYAPGGGETLYSVANLFEPGILDPLSPEVRLRGLVFFFQAAPGRETGARLQRMLGAVRDCATRLEGRVEDQLHRPMTAARELELKLAATGERNFS